MKAQFIELNTIDQLEELFEVSSRKPIVLFKHSTTCPISANVFEDVANLDSTIFLITVQTARNISNKVAEMTGIKHESPQAIVIKDGKAVYNAAHYDVTHSDIASVLDQNSAL